jgi:REP element-mobilizing transposase RayT
VPPRGVPPQGKASRCPYATRCEKCIFVMMKYNPEIHHRRSIRLQNYDYAHRGIYYVTVCTYNRAHLFGRVENGIMMPNKYGEIAQNEWRRMTDLRQNIVLPEFVVMPNHIHGIIQILCSNTSAVGIDRFQNQGKNTLSSILGSYKSAVSKAIHDMGFWEEIWQRNYYERIVRDESDMEHVQTYIRDNPKNWSSDNFNKSPKPHFAHPVAM